MVGGRRKTDTTKQQDIAKNAGKALRRLNAALHALPPYRSIGMLAVEVDRATVMTTHARVSGMDSRIHF